MHAPSAEESGFDPRAFRKCLGQFSTGVTIVTADHEGKRVGVTANSFSSLSLDPPLVLWSIGRASRAFDVFNTTLHFAISVLADDQVGVSQRFAGKENDKFAGVAWHPGMNGAPLIAGSAACLECTTEAKHDAGDHVLIIGRVTRFTSQQRKVLIFSQGRYSIAVDHPILRVDGSERSPSEQAGSDESDSFGTLIFKAHLCWSDGFSAYRDMLDISVGKGRLLYLLSRHQELSFDDLLRNANLPAHEIDDQIGDLCASGHVQRNANGSLSLTAAGRRRRENIREQVSVYETDTLKGISPTDLATTRRTLAKYLAQSDRSSRSSHRSEH